MLGYLLETRMILDINIFSYKEVDYRVASHIKKIPLPRKNHNRLCVFANLWRKIPWLHGAMKKYKQNFLFKKLELNIVGRYYFDNK